MVVTMIPSAILAQNLTGRDWAGFARKMALSALFLIFFLTGLTGVAHPATLTLAEGLRLVTEENRLIRIRVQEEKIAHEDTVVARSGLLPIATGSYSNTFLRYQPGAVMSIPGQTLSVNTSEREFYSYSVKVQQLLYDFRWGEFCLPGVEAGGGGAASCCKEHKKWCGPQFCGALFQRPRS